MNPLLSLSTAVAIAALSSSAFAAIGGPGCLPEFAGQPNAQNRAPGFRMPSYPMPAYQRGYQPYGFAGLPYGRPGYAPGGFSGMPAPVMPAMPVPAMSGFSGFPGIGEPFDGPFGGPFGGGPFSGPGPWGSSPWGGYPWRAAPWAMPYPLAAPAVDDTAADDQLITGTESSIPAGPVDTDQDGVFDSADLCANTVPTAKVDGLGCSLDANIVLEGVNFHTDSAKLTDASIAILDGVAKTLTSNPNIKVEVAGHTDSDAADDYNLKLSQSRAETVVAYLASHGVKADHMTARGYGEAAPLVANDNAANKAINRRVELRRL